MLRDPEAITAAFTGTVLEGRAVVQVGRSRVLRHVADLDLRQAWQAARDAVPVTGRWPLAVSADLDHLLDPDPADVDAHAEAVLQVDDPWAVFHDEDQEPLGDEKLRTWPSHGLPPHVVERAVRELEMPTTEPAWDRWLFTQMQRDPSLQQGRVHPDLMSTARWYDPGDWCLALLPTDRPELLPVYTTYHGALCPERSVALGAVLQRWHERWGAELVASWGTMLQMLVARPPRDPDQAYELAGQLIDVAGSEQVSRHVLALSLPLGDAWFLHDRP